MRFSLFGLTLEKVVDTIKIYFGRQNMPRRTAIKVKGDGNKFTNNTISGYDTAFDVEGEGNEADGNIIED